MCTGDDPERAQHPINCIEWSDAARFCEQLGKRLPTEAEWELAARDKGGNYYPWGDEPPSAKRLNACGAECVAWGKAHGETLIAMYSEDDGFATTAPVGTYAAEGEIADLAGNVWEWTANFYASYTKDAERDPRGPKVGKERVIRGGAYNGSYPDWVRPSFRDHSVTAG